MDEAGETRNELGTLDEAEDAGRSTAAAFTHRFTTLTLIFSCFSSPLILLRSSIWVGRLSERAEHNVVNVAATDLAAVELQLLP